MERGKDTLFWYIMIKAVFSGVFVLFLGCTCSS